MRRRSAKMVVSLLLVLVPAAVVFGTLYYLWIHKPSQENKALNDELMKKIVGLKDEPVNNTLAKQFSDADNDLVADAPKDSARLVDPDPLVFCWIGEEEAEKLRDEFKDFMGALEKATGKKVTYYTAATSSDEQLAALRDGKLHITAFSTGAVPIAVNQAGFVPVGMLAGESGSGKHQMQIIVPAASSVASMADLRDKELVLTEPNSNSGYKAPIVLMKDANLIVGKDYRIRNSMSYWTSIEGIAKKQYDAAAVASDVLERAVAQGKIKKADYKVIFSSKEFPSAAIGYAHNLKPETASKVREAILAFNFKGTSQEARFASSSQTRFAPVTYKADWELVRLIDNALGQPHRIK